MNIIQSRPIAELGCNFVDPQYLPDGQDEFYLRNQQFNSKEEHKPLTPEQIDTLIRNQNSSDNWNNIFVTSGFSADYVKNCKFYGRIRIGSLSAEYREFHDIRLEVGLYNSTIISCDFGNNICIDQVDYLSHYIIDDDVMISNVNELSTTSHAKFGNGILKEGEEEKVRTWIEVCNENAGRGIIPFNGMLPGDAYLWSRSRHDDALQQKFREFAEKKFDKRRGYYGTIGKRTVIKNSRIIKDAIIGSDAYIKGANKLKNLTINSDAERKSQIGEGCELVNGVVGFGCRIFYGVKAVRFILSSHSQLKYGARLINSYLGNNSTISCCEVLNSLIFPSHEQHHNNSFLCASLILGQSNIAAGATIGSNHNSRSADGEIVAGRGFWPGLCVSLKHNSKFASFTLIAKGDYSAELNIPVPFCLVSNDYANDRLVVSPAYWFAYNMYALERNSWKYNDRDRRTGKLQRIEYDYLAPDTINEIFDALNFFQTLEVREDGSAVVSGWENSRRKTVVLKVPGAQRIFKDLVKLYAGSLLLQHVLGNKFNSFDEFRASLPAKVTRSEWLNIGGQLIKKEEVEGLKRNIRKGNLSNWDEVHDFYREQGKKYDADKLEHAFTSYLEIENITIKQFDIEAFHELLDSVVETKTWMTKGIYESRAKDYTNPFRKMVYENEEEMKRVVGSLEDNGFIQMQYKKMDELKQLVTLAKKLQ